MAALRGRALDASGAVITGASITVQDQSTGFVRAVATDSQGRYHVEAIPVGTYDVIAGATGFRTEIVEQLTLEVGRTVVRDFRLVVGTASETVVVRADVPLVDRGDSH